MHSHLKSLFLVAGLSSIPFSLQAHVFETDTIDNNVSIGANTTDIAFDNRGNRGICYFDDTHNALKFATHDGRGWATETVDNDGGSGDNVGLNCSFLYDRQGNPHIVYFNETDGDLKHAVKARNAWLTETIDDNVSLDWGARSRLSLAMDSRGNLGVAYYEARNRDLKYATHDSRRWTVTTVLSEGTVGRHPTLAYDSQDKPAISCAHYLNDLRANLLYVAHDGRQWNTEIVDNETLSGDYSSLGFDGNIPHVAYHVINGDGLQYLRYKNRNGGVWSRFIELDHGAARGSGSGLYIDMVIGEHHDAYIAARQHFDSALFGHFKMLRFYSLSFIDDADINRIDVIHQDLAANAWGDYYDGISVALDDNNNLAVSWASEQVFNRTYTLMAARLTAWRPVIRLNTPDAQSIAADGHFEFEWDEIDREGRARIRFYYRDAEFNNVLLEEINAGQGHHQVNTRNLPGGNHVVWAAISNDDFNTFGSSTAPRELTVDHPRPIPQAQPVQEAPAADNADDADDVDEADAQDDDAVDAAPAQAPAAVQPENRGNQGQGRGREREQGREQNHEAAGEARQGEEKSKAKSDQSDLSDESDKSDLQSDGDATGNDSADSGDGNNSDDVNQNGGSDATGSSTGSDDNATTDAALPLAPGCSLVTPLDQGTTGLMMLMLINACTVMAFRQMKKTKFLGNF